MPDIAISVEHLSKSYLVGHNVARAERYTALRDVVARNARNLARKTRDMITGRAIVQGDEVEEFWALKDVSFTVERGERVGIIGRNGAGKSTLLKLLSRITEPTEGRICIAGRVASLLEVGTGFHSELSGRENIFLNGAILGMTRSEIRRKFDEIVAFAEVEKFIDTPVKRYSSGMYVRLAFAVAAHLEVETLIVDEVLAVGDAQFQAKCLDKMEEIGRGGRTVLFVSHNMAMVSSLCEKAIRLENGEMRAVGPTEEVIAGYETTMDFCSFRIDYRKLRRRVGDEFVQLLGASVHDKNGKPAGVIQSDEAFLLRVEYRIISAGTSLPIPFLQFFRADGTCAFIVNAGHSCRSLPGDYVAECHVPRLLLNTGAYSIRVAMSSFAGRTKTHFDERGALTFIVKDPVSLDHHPMRDVPGAIRPSLMWNFERIN